MKFKIVNIILLVLLVIVTQGNKIQLSKIKQDNNKDVDTPNIIDPVTLDKVDEKYIPNVNTPNGVPFTKNPTGNQKTAFPNLYNQLTIRSDFNKAENKFMKPAFSRILYESNTSKKFKRKEFIDEIKYPLYNMSRGEASIIFDFIDVNKDDLVEGNEWDAFVNIFIYPYEACDKNNNYYIDIDEWKECWFNDPNNQMVKLRGKYKENGFQTILNLVAVSRTKGMNISNYLTLRRAIYGWVSCETNRKFISLKDFKCALRTSIPSKFFVKVDTDRVYWAGIRQANDPGLHQLDFVAYVLIIQNTLVFSIFSYPSDMPYISKTNFLKAVRENRWPNRFTEEEINLFYELTSNNPLEKDNLINYESFIFFYNIHRLFNMYSNTRDNMVSKQEAMMMLEDNIIPVKILMAIDLSITDLTEQEYLEASIILQRFRLNEQDFYSFIELASKKREKDLTMNNLSEEDNNYSPAVLVEEEEKTPTDYVVKKNEKSREIFFTILCGDDKDFWTRNSVYQGFQIANLFTEIIGDNRRFTVSNSIILDKLMTMYDKVNPCISMEERENYNIYKSIPREVYLDLLSFLSLEFHITKVKIMKESNDRFINENIVKSILKDFGMINIPDTVLDLAKKGFDKLHRRIYDPNELIKYCGLVQIVASENRRTIIFANHYNLNVNNEHTHRYPDFKRRFHNSPLV